MAHFFTKKIALISFFIMIAIQMLCYNYIDYLQMEPRSIHSWRQSDCLSFMINFYNDRTTFFEPGVSNLGPTGDGKIASDFPLIQYAVAQLWKITGVSVPLYRLVNLMFLILGLFYIYKLFCYWFEDRYWLALLATGFIYTSTLLSYYGPTPLSDIQALGLSLAGFYYFIIWLDRKKKVHFILFILFFTLAGLLKMSSAFIFAIAVAYFIIRLVFGEKESKKGLLSISTVVWLILPFIPWVLWYLYAGYYNKIHPNEYFLVGIMPIWIVPSQFIKEIFLDLTREMFPIFFNIQTLVLLVVILSVWLLIHIKAFFTETYLRILIPIGVLVSFIILFFMVFGVHDYYLINMLPILVILVGLLIKEALVRFPGFFNYKATQYGLIALIIILTHQTAVLTRGRIEMKGWGFDSLVLNKEKREYLEWNSWYDRSRYAVLEDLSEQTLDSIGLTKDEKVLCLGDLTINRSLFLLNRLGYTSFRLNIDEADEFIEANKSKGLHYLIIIEWDWLQKQNLAPYFKNKVYEREGTSIYRL